MAGGFLGVDVFFVLSGYLITRLLIAEWASRSNISVIEFYKRRVRRLFPALIAMAVVTVTCASLFMADVAQSTLRDLPSAVTGLSNWWFILHHQSYFEAMGRPALFQHTWSLAVEFQYYWVWPGILCALLPIGGEIGVCAAALLFAGMSVFALFMVTSTSHAYFGTDTHSVGLFLGAALAAGSNYLPSRNKYGLNIPGFLTDVLGAISIASLILLFHSVGETTDMRYRLGLCLCGISTAALIIAATTSNRVTERLLSGKSVRWVGERSYSIYVWHWPVFQATRPGIDVALEGTPDFIFRAALTVGIAELSYRYIETPVRRGALERFLQQVRGWNIRKLAAAGLFATACVSAAGVFEVNSARRAIRQGEQSIKSFPVAVESVPTPSIARDIPRPTLPAPAAAPAKDAPASAPTDPILELPTMLVGDSVLLGVSPNVKKTLNVIGVDASIGRQASEVRDRIESLAETGQLPAIVILDLGNNGVIDERTLRAILEALKPCSHVVVINARVPRPWQDENNALLSRIVPTYQNAVVADWHTASDGHREYFSPDGIHAGPRGAQAYTDTIVAALHERKPPPTP